MYHKEACFQKLDAWETIWSITHNRSPVLPQTAEPQPSNGLSKVAAITFSFWIIKILCTTLGETGGDAVTMQMNLGYAVGTSIFAALFIVAVLAQVKAKKFHPYLYWFTIVATTTVGTTLADLADRSEGLGYAWGSALLFALVLISLGVWYKVTGTVAVGSVYSAKAEIFYWVTIMFSQTLGTALGDWAADDEGLKLGYLGGVEVFGGLLVIVLLLHLFTKINKTALFWAAFILTRPLGAVSGDLFDKPVAQGGFAISRYTASGVLAAAIILCVLLFPHRAAEKQH
jgi:uncharacterized membrane-anchored protein